MTSEGEKALKKGILPSSLEVLLENKKGISLKTFTRKYGIPARKIREWAKLGFLNLEVIIPKVRIPVEIFYRLKRVPEGSFKGKIESLFSENEEIPEKS